jgi:hypothetical protein
LPAHFIVILEDYSEEWKSPKPPRELPSGEDCKCNAIEFIIKSHSGRTVCHYIVTFIHMQFTSDLALTVSCGFFFNLNLMQTRIDIS